MTSPKRAQQRRPPHSPAALIRKAIRHMTPMYGGMLTWREARKMLKDAEAILVGLDARGGKREKSAPFTSGRATQRGKRK